MADQSEKTEEATPKKRGDAREKGQFPRTAEANTAMALLGGSLALAMSAPSIGRYLLATMGGGMTFFGLGEAPLDQLTAVELLQQTVARTLLALMGFLGTMFALSLGIGGLQAGGLITTKTLAPDFNRLNPLEGVKKFASTQPLQELAKSLIKMGLVAWACWAALASAWPDLAGLSLETPYALLEVIRLYATRLLRNAGLLFLMLAAGDYFFQRFRIAKQLRMTKEEVKEEAKAAEGDAATKARMRSIGRERIRKAMFRAVPTADVVIVNPTHIAIAIKYDVTVAPAPYVVAMGQRKVAEKIKALAFESGVPVLENKPLARALIKTAKVGSMIPFELYVAVAEVLAYVMKQRERRGAGRWQEAMVA
jgi:flagellar biosynthetic protein FlhB